MKRKLLGFTILYVLGAAILQNLGFSVFFSKAWNRSFPEGGFSGEIIGEVTGCSVTASAYVLYVTALYISNGDVKSQTGAGVLCYMQELADYAIGDIVSLSGSFKEPEQSTNPGQFNTYVYYRSRGTDLISYGPESELFVSLSERQDIGGLHKNICRIKQQLYEFRCKLAQVYDELLEEEDAGVLKGMVLGDRSGLSAELQALYRKNNISHILAISGLHIGLISGLVYGILRRLTGSYVLSGAVGIVITFAYGYMTGASDASMRAAVMLSVSMVGAMLGRTYDLLTAMGISAMIMVTVNPLKLYDAGFLFSYGAIIAIGSVYPCLEQGLGLKGRLSKTLAVTLSIQLVTLPVSLYFYGTVAIYSVFLNLLVIPMVTPILILGIAGGLLGLSGGLLSPSGIGYFVLVKSAGWLLSAAGFFVHLITGLCGLVIRLPLASVILGAMKGSQLAIYYAGLLVLCLFLCYGSSPEHGEAAMTQEKEKRGGGNRHFIFPNIRRIVVCAILLSIMLVQVALRRPVNRLTMLDVGQGDGILMQSDTGLNILVDGGSTSQSDVGQYVLQPALQFYGIRRLDYIVATHADSDHINGILYILEQSDQMGTAVGTLLIPLLCKDMEEYQELVDTALSHGVAVSYLEPGMSLQDGGIRITCLHPSARGDYGNINDMSAVLAVSFGETGILLTGDISTEVEDELLANKSLLEDIDILKVAHHGSKYSTSEEFLQLVSPELSLISCGADNSYGHPHAELLSRLEAAGSSILTTPDSGAVEITIGCDGWKVKCYR